MKDPAYFDGKHKDHGRVMQEMRKLLREGEIAESNAKGETFTPAELAEELEQRFGIERKPLIGGITRAPEYDQHAADVFGALADAGVDAPIVRDLVEQFESFTVSNVGRPLDDGQIEVMRQRFEPKLGKELADQIARWYRTVIRGDAS